MHARSVRSGTLTLITALALSLTVPTAAGADETTGPAWSDADSAPATTLPSSSTPQLEAAPGVTPADPSRTSRFSALMATMPGPVTGLTAELDSSSSVIITWTAPTETGPALTGYVLEMSDGVVTYELDWPYTETSVRIYDLDPDVSYTLRVAAVNAAGTGEYSEQVVFTTPFLYVERQAGENRFATAARIAERSFPHSGIGGAFLTNGLDFPDALAAAAAAGAAGGPVLLTRPTALVPETREQLEWLQPETLIVAGGVGVVSNGVMSAADVYAADTYRLSGKNRYGTAAEVSKMWDTAPTVYLASGLNFPDALAGAAAAGAKDSPVLLTSTTTLPSETAAALRRLKPSRIVVLGGSGAVSASVARAAKAATGVRTTVQRLSGANRYATAITISKATFPAAGVPVAFVANGTGFPDALAGAAAAGYLGGPVLLTETASASSELIDEIRRLKPRRIVVLGGTAVVSAKVVSQLNATRP